MHSKRDIERLTPEASMDYENGFYWFSAPNRLGKLCAQFELYKQIIGLPGAVIETGVFKASTLIRLATFRHFFEASGAREIFAFDAFGIFPQDAVTLWEDVNYAETYDATFGQGLTPGEVQKLLDAKGIGENVHCVVGDITKTMPGFFNKNPHLRIAFVHVDVEVYEPTMAILDNCWERLVPGGIMALDDFDGQTGAAKAINEFFSDKNCVVIRKIPYTDAPAYITKNVF